jgi:DNA-directed RNA polymerase subunit RPC12/RpoP
MPIQFECSGCKTTYEVADDLAGKAILCRTCQHRGQVKSLGAPTIGKPGRSLSIASLGRRNFLGIAALVLASAGSIATGSMLARRPWRNWGGGEQSPDDSRRRRGPGGKRGGPPPGPTT